MLTYLLVLTLGLTAGQDKTPPEKKAPPAQTPAKKAPSTDVPAPAKTPEAAAAPATADKETKELFAKLKANLAFERLRDNYLFIENKGGAPGGRRNSSGTTSERRAHGWYTKNYSKKPDGGETVMVTNPDIRFTLEKPAGKTEWQIIEYGVLDKPFKDSILAAQKSLAAMPMHYLAMRYQVPVRGSRSQIILDELIRHEDELLEKATQIKENGKTLYRFHLGEAHGDCYIDADPELKWAIVKVTVKYNRGEEHEYIADYSGIVHGSPALKRFTHKRRGNSSEEFRTVSDAEYTIQVLNEVNPAEYTMEHYNVKPPVQPWDPWTIGLIAGGGGLVLIVVLWYLLTLGKKPAASPAVPAT